MNTYIIYAIIFLSGVLTGILLMGIKLRVKNTKLNSYKRELEKEAISSSENSSRVKVLESKIEVLEKALENALKNKKFVEVFDRYQYTSSDGQHQWVKKVIYKSKRDHIDTSMIEGCKSGYTSKAQSTLSSLLNIDDHHYVCVVGFSKNSDGYNHCTVNDTLALGNYVKDHYSVANIIKKDAKMNSVKIKNGQTNKVDVITEKDIEAVLPNNYNPSDLKYKYHLKDLTAPVKKDQKAGTMDVYYRDTKLETISLNTTQAVDESGSVVFMRKMKNVVLPCVMAVVIILVVLLLVRKIMIKQRRKKRRQQRNRRK